MSKKSRDEKAHTNEKPINLDGLEFEQVLVALMQTVPKQPNKGEKKKTSETKLDENSR